MLYKLIYHPLINKIYRNLINILIPKWKWRSKIPVSGTIKINTTKGALFIKTNPTSYATKHIFWDGLDNFEYVPIFKNLISNLNRFIDIGANTGIYSTLGCLFNKDLKVLAFEPSSGPFEYLQKNISVNNLSQNIVGYKIALSDKAGKAEFFEVKNAKYHYLDYNLGGVGNLSGKISHRQMDSITVQTVRLDDFLKESHPTFIPDLIKIDTEATEHLVLAGMPLTISDFRPIIICETLYNRIENKIEDFFIGNKYVFLNHLKKENRLLRVKSIKRTEDDGVRDCFIVPEEKIGLFKDYLK